MFFPVKILRLAFFFNFKKGPLQELQQEPQPLEEFPPPPPGSTIHIPSAFNLDWYNFEHVLVMTSDGENLLHFSLNENYNAFGAAQRKMDAQVVLVPWKKFYENVDQPFFMHKPTYAVNIKAMKSREKEALDHWPKYHLFINNCQHFSSYIVNGSKYSFQIYELLTSVGIPPVLAAHAATTPKS